MSAFPDRVDRPARPRPAGRWSPRSWGARTALVLAAGTTMLVSAGIAVPAAGATPGADGAAVVVPTPAGTAVSPPAVSARAVPSRAVSAQKVVAYAGVRLTVPASWPVVDLDAHPTACIRFDRHTVYLGAAGPDQSCPARVVGHTETVWIAPAGSTGLRSAAAAPGAVPADAVDTMEQRVTTDPARTGVTVTATWGADEATARRVVASSVLTRVVTRPRVRGIAGVVPMYPVGTTATRATGLGFDACAAPSVTTMAAWRASPFQTIGVYLGGRNRGCAQPNLTGAWMGAVAGYQGWHVLPLYVGRQAPCIGRSDLALISSGSAFAQGVAEATDAMADAQLVGLHPGSALYNDMEGYPRGGECTATVLAYLNGWTNMLHQRGWLSGVYSSASGAIADLAAAPARTGYTAPDLIWTARWDDRTALFGEPYVSDSQWANQQRVKQFWGDHTERWGGQTISIDSDALDAQTGTIALRTVLRMGVVVRAGTNARTPLVRILRAGTPLYYTCASPGQPAGGKTRWLRVVDGTFFPEVAAVSVAGRVPACSLPVQVLSAVNLRLGPSPAGVPQGVLAAGNLATVSCQALGTQVGASRVWDRLTTGWWIADTYAATQGHPGFTAGYPRC